MISSLNGIVSDISANAVTLDVGGVGYLVNCSPQVASKCLIGETMKMVVHTDVREDAITLYGFLDKMERQVFLLLKTVKGIGSRTALEVISQMSPIDLLRTIGSGDLIRLQSLKGVGKKTAERIVVELKEAVGEFAVGQSISKRIEISSGSSQQDTVAALVALGFSESAAKGAVDKVIKSGSAPSGSGEFVKLALAFI